MPPETTQTDGTKEYGHSVHINSQFPTDKELTKEFGKDGVRAGKKLSQIVKRHVEDAFAAGQIIHTQWEAWCKPGRGSDYGKRLERWLALFAGVDRKSGDRWRNAYVSFREVIEQDGKLRFEKFWEHVRLGALYKLSGRTVTDEIRSAAIDLAKGGTPVTVSVVDGLLSNGDNSSCDADLNVEQIASCEPARVELAPSPVVPVTHPVEVNGVSDLPTASSSVVVVKGSLEEESVEVSDLSIPEIAGEDIRDSISRLKKAGLKFPCISADPPWPYHDNRLPFPTMTVAELCDLDVASLAAEDCFLHLWTTSSHTAEAFLVLKSWGFEPKSQSVWIKDSIGMGNYWRQAHELVLLGKKGNAEFLDHSFSSWFEAPRGELHSSKPQEFRDRVEAVCTGPYLELFARGDAPDGWVFIGNETEPPTVN